MNEICERRIKILNIFSGVGGGISTWIRKCVEYSPREIVIDAMAFKMNNNNGFIDIITAAGGHCYEMPLARNGIFKLINYIVAKIKENEYDIVHCHIDGYAALPVYIACVVTKTELIIHSHRVEIEKYQFARCKTIIYSFDRLINRVITKNRIACSDNAKKFAFGKANTFILFNGIERSLDCNSIKSNDILMVGRLNEVKNHKYALSVIQSLVDLYEDFHFYILGDGPLKSDLQKNIEERQLQRYVSIIGYVDNPNAYYSKSKIVLLPSLSEGFPFVALEAQQNGTYVIASNKVPAEVDLGIGLMDFEGITESDIDKWAIKIKEVLQADINIEEKVITDAFVKKGMYCDSVYDKYYQYIYSLLKRGIEN